MTDDTDKQKDVEHYAASINAWINSALEHDKSLLALSAGGVGLLTTLMTTVGISSIWMLVFYVLAMFCFLISLFVVLFIFKRNKHHIEQVIKGNDAIDCTLSILDYVAISFFGMGVLFAAIIGISSAITSYNGKEKQMTNENSKPPIVGASDRVHGMATVKKSVSGIAQLKPQPQQPVSQSTTAPTSPTSPAQPAASSSKTPGK